MWRPKRRDSLTLRIALFLLSFGVGQSAYAHLMSAQKGTLNIVEEGAYLVLSLPASAFSIADTNGDGELSMQEFNRHRGSVVALVRQRIVLSDSVTRETLEGIMLSPTSAHSDNGDVVSQLIVMGRFPAGAFRGALRFEADLFGPHSEEQRLEITATHRASARRSVFELTKQDPASPLFASSK